MVILYIPYVYIMFTLHNCNRLPHLINNNNNVRNIYVKVNNLYFDTFRLGYYVTSSNSCAIYTHFVNIAGITFDFIEHFGMFYTLHTLQNVYDR